MHMRLFWGPDRVPFALTDEGQLAAAPAIPFHGIVGRGLLNLLSRERQPASVWHEHAHRIDAPPTSEDAPQLIQLRAWAHECQSLSFAQSALAAQAAVDAFAGSSTACELWNVKEGHTSSVWRLQLQDPDGGQTICALNVARDAVAGVELRTVSAFMQAAAGRTPGLPMAAVLDLSEVCVRGTAGAMPVVVTRNVWVDGAHEIHQLTGADGQDRLVLVERFITRAEGDARIRAVRGRTCSPEERQRIHRDIACFMAEACAGERFRIDINDGDVVWSGGRSVVVAMGYAQTEH